MKKLQLFKHIAGEIAKNKDKDPKMFIGRVDDHLDYITNSFVIWLLPSESNPFKEVKKNQEGFNKLIKNIISLPMEKVNTMITLQDKSIFEGRQFVRGILKEKDFYFNPDLLKYFDKDHELYKNEDDPYIVVKEHGQTVGMILPLRFTDATKEAINKKLGI